MSWGQWSGDGQPMSGAGAGAGAGADYGAPQLLSQALATPAPVVPKPPPSIVKHEAPILLHKGSASAAVQRRNVALSTPAGVPQRTLEVLDAVLPPTEWSDASGNVWMRHPARRPATRDDVFDVQEQLDVEFVARQARPRGVCSIREELYSQTFGGLPVGALFLVSTPMALTKLFEMATTHVSTDELLRQITLRLPERGLLLLRVRDQLRLTLAAYRTLYATSCDFGNRKLCAATEGTDTLQAQLKGLEGDIERLVAQRTELERVCEAAGTNTAAEAARRAKLRSHEVDRLRFANQQLSTFIAQASGGDEATDGAATPTAGGGSGRGSASSESRPGTASASATEEAKSNADAEETA